MTPHQSPIAARVARLDEITHELSNCVGMTMNALVCSGTDDIDRVYDHLAIATEQAMRATGALQTLMWEMRELHELVQAQKAQLECETTSANGDRPSRPSGAV